CDSTFTFNVNTPTVISATLTSTDVSCNGINDGTASVTAVGGTLPYIYQWLDGAMAPIVGETANSISNLGVGSYFVTVTDFAGCSITEGPVVITEPTAISTSISGTNVS